jgi:rhodanese-related sulfurtransferase
VRGTRYAAGGRLRAEGRRKNLNIYEEAAHESEQLFLLLCQIYSMKYFSSIIALLLISYCSVIAQVPDSLKYKSLDPYYFHLDYLKTDPALLVDVREFFEFRRSRIKDAVNIPSSGNLENSYDTINKNCALFLYCTTDFRSERVARRLYDLGFRKLYSLEGGIVAWRKEGFEVERKKVKRK